MTRARFEGEGNSLSDSLVGIGGYEYIGIIGFGSYSGFGNQKTIFDQYGGWSLSETWGLSSEPPAIPIPAFGVSYTNFTSINLNPLGGIMLGIGLSWSGDPLPIVDFGISATKARGIENTLKKYTYRGVGGELFVDEGLIRSDILIGSSTPWSEFGYLKNITPLFVARLYVMSLVNKWAKIFVDLHNEEMR